MSDHLFCRDLSIQELSSMQLYGVEIVIPISGTMRLHQLSYFRKVLVVSTSLVEIFLDLMVTQFTRVANTLRKQ